MPTRLTGLTLIAAVRGDLESFRKLRHLDHESLTELATGLPELVLTASAVRGVLRALRDRQVAPDLVCEWAWFVRRGFLVGGPGGIRPIEIPYEAANETEIAEALSRLSELGDDVDGTISGDEFEQLIGSLE